MKIDVYECGLREGAQAKGVSFTVEDKLKILKRLDRMGVGYVEGGNPASNPKDIEFFKRAKEMKLNSAKLCAFGSTRRVGNSAQDDANLKALLDTGAEVCTIFGKAWDLHVTTVLKTTLEDNLSIIEDSIRFLKQQGREVVFDAEHFFDGYMHNPLYAMNVILSAQNAGADWIVLCDTNGGAMGIDFYNAVRSVVSRVEVPVGVHCHNDTSCADSNSIIAVQAGAKMVQTTILGLGERCGNADLFTVIPSLQVKLGFDCIREEEMSDLCSHAQYLAGLLNMTIPNSTPYIGDQAFSHKAGMHIDGINKDSRTFEHIEPYKVGNNRRFLMSEMAGGGAIIKKIKQVAPQIQKNSPETQAVLERMKELEYEGYQFEGADASLELMIRKVLGLYRPTFQLENFKVVVDEPSDLYSSFALIKIVSGEKIEITADEGDGPVNALDKALRKALEVFYPALKAIWLSDYKVRVINSDTATAARVRVLVETTDGRNTWTTVGVSRDIIKASFKALTDSLEYYLNITGLVK